MTSHHQNNPYQIFLDIVRADLLEDRTEYSLEDLQSSYPELGETSISALHKLIHHEDVEEAVAEAIQAKYEISTFVALEQITNAKKEAIDEFFIEGLHSSLDGWEVSEKVVIYQFIHDLGLWCENCK